jgi:hypothetical protein
MRSFVIFLAALLISVSGCSHLILSDSDSTAERTGKIAARVLLVPMTIGLSEAVIHEVRMGQECQDQGLTYFPAFAGTGGCGMNSVQYMEYNHRKMVEREQAREHNTKSLIEYCNTTTAPQDCIAAVRGDKELAAQRDMQERQIEAQQDLAREQSRGIALFGTGQALMNGMNQGFNTMRLPMSSAPLAVQPYIPLNPVRPPIRCYSSNPGAMQSTTCY